MSHCTSTMCGSINKSMFQAESNKRSAICALQRPFQSTKVSNLEEFSTNYHSVSACTYHGRAVIYFLHSLSKCSSRRSPLMEWSADSSSRHDAIAKSSWAWSGSLHIKVYSRTAFRNTVVQSSQSTMINIHLEEAALIFDLQLTSDAGYFVPNIYFYCELWLL